MSEPYYRQIHTHPPHWVMPDRPEPAVPAGKPPSRRLPWILFGLTVLTTLFAGTIQQDLNPLSDLRNILYGIPFSFTLMLILGIHELGHYSFCRFHGIPATMPYFIPVPNLLGTMGAFIQIKGAIRTRRALLDIGMAGPLAGFMIALPATIIGFSLSTAAPQFHPQGFQLGSSLLIALLHHITFPNLPEGFGIIIHPIGFAGYIGLFITSLNLLPVGQLDGGHIASALFGQRQWRIARYFMVLLVPLGFLWVGWWFWLALLLILGSRHPVIQQDAQALSPLRRKLAWLTIIIFILTFVPAPFSIY